jgi:hypothetical protein
LQYSIQKDSAYDEFFEREWFIEGSESPWSGSALPGQSHSKELMTTRRFAVTGGVEATFKFMAAKWVTNDTVTVINTDLTVQDVPTA